MNSLLPFRACILTPSCPFDLFFDSLSRGTLVSMCFYICHSCRRWHYKRPFSTAPMTLRAQNGRSSQNFQRVRVVGRHLWWLTSRGLHRGCDLAPCVGPPKPPNFLIIASFFEYQQLLMLPGFLSRILDISSMAPLPRDLWRSERRLRVFQIRCNWISMEIGFL